jgi:shikimate kinase
MGSGKSAVGRRLAQNLGIDFCDSDDEIEARTGVDIPFIFDKEGEPGFRRREKQVIEELTSRDSIVLATGGGAVEDSDNRARLASRGTVVYLYATIDQQLERTRKGRERPMLKNSDPRARLDELMVIRDPLYRGITDIVVETDGRQINAVAREIEERLARLDGIGA